MPGTVNRERNTHEISTWTITEPACLHTPDMVAAWRAGLSKGLRRLFSWLSACSLCFAHSIPAESKPELNPLFYSAFPASYYFLSLPPPTTSKRVSALHTGGGESWSLLHFEGYEKVSAGPHSTEFLKALCSRRDIPAIVNNDCNTCGLIDSFTFHQASELRLFSLSLLFTTLTFRFPRHHVIFVHRFWNASRKYIWWEAEWPLTLDRRPKTQKSSQENLKQKRKKCAADCTCWMMMR